MQRLRLRRPEQDAAANRRDIDAFADELTAGQHLQVTRAKLLEQLAPLIRAHGAVDAAGADTFASKAGRYRFGVRHRAAERNCGLAVQVAPVMLNHVAHGGALRQLGRSIIHRIVASPDPQLAHVKADRRSKDSRGGQVAVIGQPCRRRAQHHALVMLTQAAAVSADRGSCDSQHSRAAEMPQHLRPRAGVAVVRFIDDHKAEPVRRDPRQAAGDGLNTGNLDPLA